MTVLLTIFDISLMLLVVILAWLIPAGKDLFRSVVLFIAFGLIMALIWARLGVPDIALAEAAIGAGITGALLLVGLGRLGAEQGRQSERRPTTPLQRYSVPVWIALVLPSIGVILILELYRLWNSSPSPHPAAAVLPPTAAVEHPVTAVLLQFRAWDTLLEIGVLLLALITIWSLDRAAAPFRREPISPVLVGLSRVVLPILILTSGALLWQGSRVPGGAFQAGALLTAGIILAFLAGRDIALALRGLFLRLLMAGGLLVFLLVAAATLTQTGTLLRYPMEYAADLILLIEWAATISIAVLLAAAIAGGHPDPDQRINRSKIPPATGDPR